MRRTPFETVAPRSLPDALYRALHESERDTQDIASEVGCRPGYLLDAVNPDRDEVQFQLRLLIPFMRATRSLTPLHWIARAMGGVFVAVPEATADHADVRKAFVDVVRELGEDAALIEQVLADGQVDSAEAERVAQELDETVAALVAVKKAIQQKVTRAIHVRLAEGRR